MSELTDALAKQFQLTHEERAELLASGQQTIFSNRVAWCKSHLKYAGLLNNPKRGRVIIAEIGLKVLDEKPALINVKYLKRFPAYVEFIGKAQVEPDPQAVAPGASPTIEQQLPPDEVINAAYQTLLAATAKELLSRLKSCPPSFFESVVVQLLMRMGGIVPDEGHSGVFWPDTLACQAQPS